MGYIPDWQRQSAAKNQPQAQTKSPTQFGVVSKPIFHAEKALHSQGTQTPFTRHYADASEGGVGSDTDNRNFIQKIGDSIAEGSAKRDIQAKADGYDQKDKGLLGGDINYREDSDGRKFVQKKDPMSGRMEEQRYYSGDDVKQGFKNLFGMGEKREADKSSTAPGPISKSTTTTYDDMNESRKKDLFKSKSDDTSTKGAFSNVDAAVKSATKEPEGGGSTSFTGGTKPRPSQTTAKKVGRQDVAGSSAQSFPLKKDGQIGDQEFPMADAKKSPVSSKRTDESGFDMGGDFGTQYSNKPFSFTKQLEADTARAAATNTAIDKSAARTRAGTLVDDKSSSGARTRAGTKAR
jgi:hypothetical protein